MTDHAAPRTDRRWGARLLWPLGGLALAFVGAFGLATGSVVMRQDGSGVRHTVGRDAQVASALSLFAGLSILGPVFGRRLRKTPDRRRVNRNPPV